MTQRHTPWKHYTKKTVALLLSFCLLISSLVIPAVAEDSTTVYTTGEVTRLIDPTQYIVLDLDQGNITINAAKYTGYLASIENGEVKWTLKTDAPWKPGEKFYMIQSSTKKSISIENGKLKLVSVDINEELFVNQSDVNQAISDWQTAANNAERGTVANGNRTGTLHYIEVASGGSGTYEIYLDDIWSANQYSLGDNTGQNKGGGVRIYNAASTMNINLRLVGDNRLASFFYDDNTNNTGSLVANVDNANFKGLNFYDGGELIKSYKGGAEVSVVGSLVTVGNPEAITSARGAGNYLWGGTNAAGRNNWQAVMGCGDDENDVYDFVFRSGVIYVAANENENVTAIGGGGNGHTSVTVKGGKVTAVAHGTGTAIGGGIAHTGTGGAGTVFVTGGAVYAYNYGLLAYDRVKAGTFDNIANIDYTRKDSPFVPGTAIGGAGSLQQTGRSGTVTINGGYVYAWSRGGAAIGGGNTIVGDGGAATVTINGGTVKAVSTSYQGATNYRGSGTVPQAQQMANYDIPIGTAIGGGSTTRGTGGTATVTISGEKTDVTAHGIGGGNSELSTGGKGTVTIHNGTIDVIGGIGGGDSKTTGVGGEAKVTVNGGKITATGVIGGGSSSSNKGGKATLEVYGGSLSAAGVGGGNSVSQIGGEADVTIAGGEVYSTGVIGGGNSTTMKGGNAKLTVSSGLIKAHGIGGGASVDGDGGDATVTVSGGRVTSTADIGGGSSEEKNGGTATVTVSGGTLVSNGIGGGYSEKYGYSTGNVTVTGGSLNSSMAAIPVNGKGETLFLTRISLFRKSDDVEETMAEKQVIDNSIVFRTAPSYNVHDIFTDQIGMIYLWLPLGVAVTGAKMANGDGTGEDLYAAPASETDGDIDAGDVGVLVYNSTLPRYIFNVAGSGYYTLYLDQEMTQPFSGSVVVPQSDFTFYLRVQKDVSLTPYQGIMNNNTPELLPMPDPTPIMKADGVTQDGTTIDGVDYLYYSMSHYVYRDTEVRFKMKHAGENAEYYVLDLTGGNVTITEDANGVLTIDQNGYKMPNFTGKLYLTSAGYPTDNTVTVTSAAGENSNINLYADKLNIAADGTALDIQSGNVHFSFGESDNQIRAEQGSPITVTGNASLNITLDGKDSLKINNREDAPLISGAGELVLDEKGGFLQMSGGENTEIAQIAVGSYTFIGTNEHLSAELYKGEGYAYTVIGFVAGENNDEKLYPKTHEPGDGEKLTNFRARGFYSVFQGVEIVGNFSVTDVGGDFVITLMVSDDAGANAGYIGNCYVMGANNTPLEKGVDYTVTGTEFDGQDNPTKVTLSVKGSCFLAHNLTIFASAGNYIAYSVISPQFVYDGREHTFSLEYDTTLFEVRYSMSKIVLDGSGKPSSDTELLTVKPTYTDVTGTTTDDCAATVYFCLTKIAGKEGTYAPAIGSVQVLITQGENKWNTDFYCTNVIEGSVPKPNVRADWGNDAIIYQFQMKINSEWTAVDPNTSQWPEGDYRAMATIPDSLSAYKTTGGVALLNYGAITSDWHQFKVIKVSVYRTNGKQLDLLVESETGPQSITKERGAFTVRYTAQGTGAESRLHFVATDGTTDILLPTSTKLTLINITNMTYYYYVVSNPTAMILLKDFIQMGTANQQFSPGDGPVEYQFCVEYESPLSSTFNMILNNTTDNGAYPTFSPDTSDTEKVQANEMGTVQIGDELHMHVSVNADGRSGNRLLAIRVNRTDDPEKNEEFSNVSVSLSGLNQTLKPVHQTVDMAVFNLAASGSVVGDYTLVVKGLQAGDYTLTADLRIVEGDSYAYILQNETIENHLTQSVTVAEFVKSSLKVQAYFDPTTGGNKDEFYILTRDGEGTLSQMGLKITSSDTQADSSGTQEAPTVTVTVQRKENGKYVDIKDETGGVMTIPIPLTNGCAQLTAETVSKVLVAPGNYRLTFTAADGITTCQYDLIVTTQS